MIPTIDLFSGIGGFSYALKQVTQTVAYCEIKDDCRNLLNTLMTKKIIDKAPIFEDITQLKGSDLQVFNPKMLMCGWPCQDISGANINGKGLNGKKSGLFFEIMRLLDEISTISYVMLENSPMIRIKGLSRIKKEFKKRNFKLVWGYFSARMVGALHRRKRWICFAYKNIDEDLKLIDMKYISYDWKKQIPLIIKQNSSSKYNIARCQMLGNSIVPQMIRYAWNVLLENRKFGGEVKDIKELKNNHHEKIILYDGKNYFETKPWSTPVYTRWDQYRNIIERTSRNLPNQIFYRQDLDIPSSIPINMRDKYYQINPNFIEHLMGYPKDYTKL